MKPQETQFDQKEYKVISEYSGNKNYEIIEIISKKNTAKYEQYDSISKKIVIKSYYKSNDKAENTFETLKIDLLGNQSEKLKMTARILKDGTIWDWKYSVNWIINGDTTKYEYLKPLTNNEENDSAEWYKKFKELYANAQYVYIYMTDYYFKIEDKWYVVEAFKKSKELGLDIKKQYPPKEDQDVRMVELKDQFPDLYVPPVERDTSLIKQIKYTSTFFEKSDRGDAFNYSAGWWYFDIYMPGGDTLKIKRFASFRDPEMKLYKIPKELGGREDVLFIIQEPNEIHPEQVGGMYVIRPKNYKETPQYKEQEAKELEKEKMQKQKESQEAVRKRRSFLPDEK
ncbi:hypothetical protein [Aequorivita capsosiphonis]|uniref:hypothetical protein n=1 Tax=Aequorivita capsosiphonis TaxID=487317 RepID=UPI0004789B9A|nr:hypothetical protein [Aequorivita capsosiphonis]